MQTQTWPRLMNQRSFQQSILTNQPGRQLKFTFIWSVKRRMRIIVFILMMMESEQKIIFLNSDNIDYFNLIHFYLLIITIAISINNIQFYCIFTVILCIANKKDKKMWKTKIIKRLNIIFHFKHTNLEK